MKKRKVNPKPWRSAFSVLQFNFEELRKEVMALRTSNWLAFLTLRMDPAAQWETRQFANAVAEVVAQEFPETWAIFEAGRK